MRCDLSGWKQTLPISEWLVFNCQSGDMQAHEEASSATCACECSSTCLNTVQSSSCINMANVALFYCITEMDMDEWWMEGNEGRRVDVWMESKNGAESGHCFWHRGPAVRTRVLRWNHPKPLESIWNTHIRTHTTARTTSKQQGPKSQGWLWL